MSNKTKALKAFFNAQMVAMTAASLETIEHLTGENKELSEQNKSLRSDLSVSLQDAIAQEKIIAKLRSVNVDLDLKLKGRDSNFGSVNEEAKDENNNEQHNHKEACGCPERAFARKVLNGIYPESLESAIERTLNGTNNPLKRVVIITPSA